MRKIISYGIAFLSMLGTIFVVNPAFAVDQDVVYLRKDCSGVNAGQTCFTTVGALQSWLWTTRNPTASSRVAVHIGPGEFTNGDTDQLNCPDGKGYVSFIGSGPETTKLSSPNVAVFIANNCTDIHVQDLTIQSNNGFYPIIWNGGGSSRWVNVDIIGQLHAWSEIGCAPGKHPIHYWFSSRLKNTGTGGSGAATYRATCGESWFYGSELTYLVQEGASGTVVSVNGNADVRAFGTVIRAIVPAGANPAGSSVIGVRTRSNAMFHMHGSIVSLDVSSLTSNVEVSALEAYNNSMIHTPGASFALKAAGTGQIYRTYSDSTAMIHSPFEWPPANNPPALVSDPQSSDGADTFVETDCNASGNCDTAPIAEQRPHLMVYTTKCSTSGPWYDIGRNKCRGEP
jgi:hypothetical protein